jgi:hypothetical protein
MRAVNEGPQLALGRNLERAQKYRQRAAELLTMAERAKGEDQRWRLLDTAAIYHRLASRLEEEPDES